MLRSLSLTVDRFPYSLEEHRIIADAYKNGDEKLLEEGVKNHLTMFKDHILQSDFVNKNFG